MNISILTPTYNRSKFLNLYLFYIKNQDYDHNLLEVIIDDDGSDPFITDIETIKDFLSPIKLKYYRYKEKRSIGEKRNNLINLSKNDVVCFMDDDDMYLPTYISHSYSILKNNNAELVGSKSMLFCFINEDFKVRGGRCSKVTDIHEATIMMRRSCTSRFNNSSQGEGVHLINSLNSKESIAYTDIGRVMVCIVRDSNTINKDYFNSDNMKLGINIIIDPSTKQMIEYYLLNNK